MFPLLKLPSLVLEKIIPELHFGTIVYLSMRCPKLAHAISHLSSQRGALTLFLDNLYANIIVQRENHQITLRVLSGRFRSRFVEKMCGIAYSWPEHFPGRVVIELQCMQIELSIRAQLEVFIGHLKSTFKFKIFNFTCHNWAENHYWLPANIENFNSIHIGPSATETAFFVTPEKLVHLLENVNYSNLYLHVTQPETKYQKPLRGKIIHLVHPLWLDLENLEIGETCEELEFTFKNFKNAPELAMNRIFKKWEAGETGKLEMLKINSGSLKKMLEGIRKEPSGFNSRQMEHLKISDPRPICDIVAADGRLATVAGREGLLITVVFWTQKTIDDVVQLGGVDVEANREWYARHF